MYRESFFFRGSLFSAWLCRLLGVMTRFLQTKNDPSGGRKWTPGGRFSMGVFIRRYTGRVSALTHPRREQSKMSRLQSP